MGACDLHQKSEDVGLSNLLFPFLVGFPALSSFCVGKQELVSISC